MCSLNGIQLYYVDCKDTSKNHPNNPKIKGKLLGRNWVFEDGLYIDRDDLATLNIGQRLGSNVIVTKKKRKKVIKQGPVLKEIKNCKKTCATPKQMKRKHSLRKETYEWINSLSKKQNRYAEMVAYLPSISENSASAEEVSAWRVFNRNELNGRSDTSLLGKFLYFSNS